MKVKLKGHLDRNKEARELWLKVGTDINSGMRVAEVAKRYINPKTGKHYGRAYIYWIVKKLNSEKINA